MMKIGRGYLYFFAAASVSLLAQNTAGTGSISGLVVDATGAAVPGAQVVVANQSQGVKRELLTTESGLFNAAALTPASGYSVTVTKAGFANYEIKNIQLQVGQTVSLAPTLAVASATTQVEVTGAAPLLEASKTNVSGVVDSLQIQDLPINGRRVDNFVLLQPAVTSDAGFGLLTFRGLAGGNSFLTDGVDTTNNFYDENAGRTRTINISQDSVQEFQVITSGSLAEYGRASGGVVNTITRSGTNNFHGTAYWFFRNRTLNATDISANGAKPQDWRHQAGVSIGGPIKKDKLFFFFNGELQRRSFPIASSNIQNKTLFTGPAAIKPAECKASASQCSAVMQFIISRAEPQLVPRTSDVNLMFGKVDYQINDKNRATFELNYLDFRSPNGIQTQVSLIDGSAVGNNANTTVFDRTGKAGLTTILSANMLNELKFGYFKDRQYDPNSPSLLPPFGPIGLSISGTDSISNIGYSTNYNRLDPSEQRFQIADTLSYLVGNHNLKFGFDYANVEDYVKLIRNPYGTYSYSSLTNLALDFSNAGAVNHWTTFTEAFGNPTVDTTVNEFAAFIQDEWHVNAKLTISPGIRYEKDALPEPPTSGVNPLWPQTGNIPQTDLNFAPRLGMAYAMNDKTVLRADYGMFYNRYVTAAISNFFSNNGILQSSYTINNVAGGPTFPNSLAAQPSSGAATPNIAFADPAFRPAYSEQASFSVERQLSASSSFTASYLWNRGLHLISGTDLNVAPATQTYTYPILDLQNNVTGSFTTPIYSSKLTKNFGQIIDVTSSNNSYYNGLALQYRKRYSTWLQGQVSYTWSHAIDYNIGGGGNTLFTPSFPTSFANGDYSGDKGSSSTDQRHRMVANFIFSPKFSHGNSWFDRYVVNNWQLSALTIAASAQPLVPVISVGSRPAGYTFYQTSTINGLGGSTRVPFQSISALDGDQLYRTDARISKVFPAGEHLKFTLLFEAFNIFNHHSYAGAAPRTTREYSTSTVNINGVSKVALVPNATYGAWGSTSAPLEGTTARRAQAALRIEF